MLLRFRSVRARLLALMLLVLAPLAILSMVLATTTYRSVTRALELAQIEVVSNYAVRTRIWFRGALRMTLAMNAAVQSAKLDDGACAAALRDVSSAVNGVQAVSLRMPGVAACDHSIVAAIGPQELDRIRQVQRSRPPLQLWAGLEMSHSRYDAVHVGGALHLVIYARLSPPDGPLHELLVLMDPNLLDVAFELGQLDSGVIVSLMNRGQQVLVARGAPEADRDWLPRDEAVFGDVRRAQDQDGSGARRTYVSQLVSEPDMYVLASFDHGPERAALVQFLILSLTPLLTLAVLFVAYAAAIRNDVLRWVRAIEAGARARLAGGSQRVAIDSAMPQELRRVAEAHNAMIEDVERRERALQGSLAHNLDLVRDLNHHVKNSLQVIQSYLALSRRENSATPEPRLLETEAKVLVLSAAYRLALRDGSFQTVPVKPFLDEIAATLSAHLRAEGQWIDVRVHDDMFPVVVDRAIPLGLAVVEAVAGALRAPDCRIVEVQVKLTGADSAALTVGTDSPSGPSNLPPRIMQGLAAQIGAVREAAEGSDFLRWTLRR